MNTYQEENWAIWSKKFWDSYLGTYPGNGCYRARELVGGCGTEWSRGIGFSGNPSCVEGGDVEQVCSNLETNPLCLRLLLLSLSLIVLYLACLYCFHIYMLDILVCSYWYIAWGLFANTSIQPREPTRHLNPYLGESWGVSPEPFTGNSATLLCYT